MRVFNLINREARKAYGKEIKINLSNLESLLFKSVDPRYRND